MFNLHVRDLTFAYARPLIDSFSLETRPSEPTSLNGDSGSGKTTIIKLYAGLIGAPMTDASL